MQRLQRLVQWRRRGILALALAVVVLGMVLPDTALAAPASAPVTLPVAAPATHGYGCDMIHIVRRGQTLTGIANYYGVSPYALAKVNDIHNWNKIYVGQQLCIPGYGPPPPP